MKLRGKLKVFSDYINSVFASGYVVKMYLNTEDKGLNVKVSKDIFLLEFFIPFDSDEMESKVLGYKEQLDSI